MGSRTNKTGTFIGFTGLNQLDENLPSAPCVEIGWRLAKPFWKRGYATEAGMAGLRFAFVALGLAEVVSFTSSLNKSSIAVMERIGMINQEKNFFHPNIKKECPLWEHVLFSITKQKFIDQNAQFRKK